MRARKVVAAGEEAVKLAERAASIARTRYASGGGTFLELQEAIVALGRARLGRTKALRDHMNARARLRYACGAPDGERGRGK